MIQCPICQAEIPTPTPGTVRPLLRHVRHHHRISAEQLWAVVNGKRPRCEGDGCRKLTNFQGYSLGYFRYCFECGSTIGISKAAQWRREKQAEEDPPVYVTMPEVFRLWPLREMYDPRLCQ